MLPPLAAGVGSGSPFGAGSGLGTESGLSIAESGVAVATSGFGSTTGILSVGVFSVGCSGVMLACCDVVLLLELWSGAGVSICGDVGGDVGESEELGGTVTTDGLLLFSSAWSVSTVLALAGP